MVNIDQRPHFQGAKITSQEPVVRRRSWALALTKRVPRMPSSHALPTGSPLRAIERPRCPHCQTRTFLAGIAPGPAGYELRTFECPKCDRAQRTLVVNDSMTGDARGWLAGELKSPD